MKTLKIVLIVIVILVVAIWLLKLLNNDKKGVEISYVKVDTVYVESNKRDSIAKLIDTIFINNANNTKNEELHKAVVDSDSVAIVRKFIELCSKPVGR